MPQRTHRVSRTALKMMEASPSSLSSAMHLIYFDTEMSSWFQGNEKIWKAERYIRSDWISNYSSERDWAHVRSITYGQFGDYFLFRVNKLNGLDDANLLSEFPSRIFIAYVAFAMANLPFAMSSQTQRGNWQLLSVMLFEHLQTLIDWMKWGSVPWNVFVGQQKRLS